MANSTMNGHQNGHNSSSSPYIAVTPEQENWEAERALLGAMVLDKTACQLAFQLVQRDALLYGGHQAIFDVIARLSASGIAVDIVSIASGLRGNAEVERAGGIRYIGDCVESCPTAANVRLYAMLVNESATARRMKAAAQDVLSALQQGATGALPQAIAKLNSLEHEREQTRERFKPMTWAELGNLKPAPQLIEGVMQAGTLTVIYGAPGSFKSFFALDLALSVATGKAWHGRQVLAGPAVYIAGEGIGGLGKRVRAWSEFYNRPHLQDFYAITDPPSLPEDSDVDTLIAQLKTLPKPPKLVIFDTLARCMGGRDENSTGDMSALINGAGRIQREFGCAVLLIHHTGKDGKMRGNSSLLGGVDTQIGVTSKHEIATLTCEKQKDYDPFKPLSFIARHHNIGENASLVFEMTKVEPEKERLTGTEEDVLKALGNETAPGITSETWRKRAMDEGVPRSSFFKAKKSLLARELVAEKDDFFLAKDVS